MGILIVAPRLYVGLGYPDLMSSEAPVDNPIIDSDHIPKSEMSWSARRLSTTRPASKTVVRLGNPHITHRSLLFALLVQYTNATLQAKIMESTMNPFKPKSNIASSRQ
jgi:hypothetical protein